MEYKRYGDKYVVRLDKGDEIVASLEKLAREEEIKLAYVTGIGAVDKARVGLFKPANKEYISKDYDQDMEIVHLAGNISQMEGETYIHLHIALSDETYQVFGGHLNHAYVSVTGEIVVQLIDGSLDRTYDQEIGVNLLKF